MAEYPQEVRQRFHGTPEQMDAALVGEPPERWQSIVIEDYDPAWADRFAAASSLLSEVLGNLIISVEHVGSTSVPGLAAKPIIDIDLLIEETTEEAHYIPALERLGYRLVLREPWWYGHRMLRLSASGPTFPPASHKQTPGAMTWRHDQEREAVAWHWTR